MVNWAFNFAVGPYDVFVKRGVLGSFPLQSRKINFNTTQTLLVGNYNNVSVYEKKILCLGSLPLLQSEFAKASVLFMRGK